MQLKINIKSKFRLELDKSEALILMMQTTMNMSKRSKKVKNMKDNAPQKMEAMLRIQ